MPAFVADIHVYAVLHAKNDVDGLDTGLPAARARRSPGPAITPKS
jgi:hypothetical protein